MGQYRQPTLTDVTLITKEEDLPDDLYKPGLKLFVCSVDAALQRKCVDACDTLTTSLGPVRDRCTLPLTTHPSESLSGFCQPSALLSNVVWWSRDQLEAFIVTYIPRELILLTDPIAKL